MMGALLACMGVPSQWHKVWACVCMRRSGGRDLELLKFEFCEPAGLEHANGLKHPGSHQAHVADNAYVP